MVNTTVPLISYLLCNLSRLAYFDNDVFLQNVINDINIPAFKTQLIKIRNITFNKIFKDNLTHRNEITKKINDINYFPDKKEINHHQLENVKYVCISTSNYSSVYILAIKDINAIFVCFRGTYSPKSASSWSKIRHSIPFQTCNSKDDKDDKDDGYMLGIFKIIAEIFYTILESITFLSNDFLNRKDYKLFTTGHSLGGAASLVFSFLFLKYNQNNKIGCITFGAPRVLNGNSMEKIIKFIKEERLMFRRYVTNGDFLANMPPLYTDVFKSTTYYHPDLIKSKTYYHPDEYDRTLNKTSIFCRYINKNTQKLKCNLKKTRKTRPNLKYHGNYLGISFINASRGKMDFYKEIIRNEYGETICRIIVGGKTRMYSISFFILNDVKRKGKTAYDKIKSSFKNTFIVDYKHSDIYINERTFNNIIKSGYITEDYKELNPLKFDKLVKIKRESPREELYCL